MAMVVVTNRIPVSKGHEIDFEDRFKRRVHLVDRSPGFIRNEVHRPRPVSSVTRPAAGSRTTRRRATTR
jgi:heme-degrading monooxygenase HmoA